MTVQIDVDVSGLGLVVGGPPNLKMAVEEGTTIYELLLALSCSTSSNTLPLLDKMGRRMVIVLVNGVAIADLELQLHEGDRVTLVQVIGGG